MVWYRSPSGPTHCEARASLSWLAVVMVLIGAFTRWGDTQAERQANLSSNCLLEAQWYLFKLIFYWRSADQRLIATSESTSTTDASRPAGKPGSI